jgi:hypothetical protein
MAERSCKTDVDTEGQVTPFWLDTSDGEKLFCWHVLPLDVYLQHEQEIFQKTLGGVTDDFAATVGAKLLRKDGKSKVVVNFHGVRLEPERENPMLTRW